MNNSSELYASLSSPSIESNSSEFETLSLRVTPRTAAMASVLNTAFLRPVHTLFTDRLSQLLADSLVNSPENDPLIREELAHGVQSGSALSILVNTGVIKQYVQPAVFRGEID